MSVTTLSLCHVLYLSLAARSVYGFSISGYFPATRLRSKESQREIASTLILVSDPTFFQTCFRSIGGESNASWPHPHAVYTCVFFVAKERLDQVAYLCHGVFLSALLTSEFPYAVLTTPTVQMSNLFYRSIPNEIGYRPHRIF